MSLKLECADCQSWFALPENAPAKVRCPKCKGVLDSANAVPVNSSLTTKALPPTNKPTTSRPAVDTLEVVEDEQDLPRAPSRRSSRRHEDEEEDDRRSRRGSREDQYDIDDRDDRRSRRSRRDEDYDEEPPSRRRSSRDDEGDVPRDILARGQDLSVPFDTLSPALQNKIESTLSKREEIVYLSQPSPSAKAWKNAPFSIFGMVFVIFAMGFIVVGATTNQMAFMLFPLIFVVVGGGMILAPLFSYLMAKNTAYVLTGRRGLVFENTIIFGVRMTSYSRRQVEDSKKQHSWMVKGAGDLVMREEVHVTHHYSNRGGYRGSSTQLVQYGFMAIQEVDAVEELIHDLFMI